MANHCFRAEKIRPFSNEWDFDAPVVRVANSLVNPLGGRAAWITICSGDRSIYRRALGAGRIDGLRSEVIELDYASISELRAKDRDADGFFLCELVLRPSSIHERFLAHWRHPSAEYRAPFHIAIVSLLLGFIGLILGVFAFFY